MNYNFVKFEAVHARFETRISIGGAYSIGLPTKFYKDNNIESYKFAVLFWDKENFAIGIQFTNNENESGGFKIVKSKDYGAVISAKSFFMKNEIDPKIYKGKYEWKKIYSNGGETFVVDLPRG